MAIDVTGINDGYVIQDNQTRNAITGLKAAVTTVGNRVCTTIASTVSTTTPVLVAATLDALINGLRTAGLMN